jgi:uncharacterized membrane protein YedE/YeeE
MKARVAGAGIGVVFGLMLVWSGMSSPDVIRQALLFEEAYLFLFMGSAVGTAVLGQALLRRVRSHSVLTGAPLERVSERPARRHVEGSIAFGIGWGVSNACPGPIAAQLGQGIGWALFTLLGVAIGIYAYQRRGAAETEPAVDPAPAPATA